MHIQKISTRADASTENRRHSQLQYLCHFLDMFASADPVMRAGAAQYGERMRDEGCDGETVIRIAATALLVAIERQLDERA